MIDLRTDNPATLLALDTSTPRAAIAIATAAGRVFAASPDPSARHGRVLVSAIGKLLAEAGLEVSDLDGFAVGLGPGSYTGLRIGLTAAKSLAYVAEKPLTGLDSLEVIAHNAPLDERNVSVIADAQRGDVYLAEFRRADSGLALEIVCPTRIVSFHEWSVAVSSGTYVLGPAAATGRFAELIPTTVRRPENLDDDWPCPLALARYARVAWQAGRRDDSWFLEPSYFRKSAAEDLWEARAKILDQDQP